MEKVCFGCVVYKEAINYLPDFFSSVFSQSDKQFDFIILNDNLEKNILEKLINKFENTGINTIILESKADIPSKLRVELLKRVKERNYGLMILGDCDDKFAFNRVRKNREEYVKNKSYAFYYNDLKRFDHSLAMQKLPEITQKIEDIGEYNYLGLSNSAINLDALDMDFIDSLNECDTNIFDWYFYSRILLNGGAGIKVHDTYTYYRIHDKNLAGLINTICDENVMHEKEIKLRHYKLLRQYSGYMNYLYKCYENSEINLTKKEFSEIPIQYWWSNIKVVTKGE